MRKIFVFVLIATVFFGCIGLHDASSNILNIKNCSSNDIKILSYGGAISTLEPNGEIVLLPGDERESIGPYSRESEGSFIYLEIGNNKYVLETGYMVSKINLDIEIYDGFQFTIIQNDWNSPKALTAIE